MGRKQVFDWSRRFKMGRNFVESDLRSGRLSTWRNQEIVAKVRTMTPNNGRLTERERFCDVCVNQLAENDRKNGGMATDPAPRQCAHRHFTSCASVFGQTRHRSVAAAAILTRSRTV